MFREYKSELLKEWINNLHTEVEFWQSWFKTKGLSWKDDFTNRTSKTPAKPSEWVSSMCTINDGEKFRVLDVGSGPISIIRGVTELSDLIELTSVDPLAPVYNIFISETCPWVQRVTFGLSEQTSAFVDGKFDLIYSRNALDHGFDPVHSLIDLTKILKPGGIIALEHYENEAEYANYSGLHHWNFAIKDGNLIFWNKEYSVDITKLLDGFAEISHEISEEDGKAVIFSKIKRISNNDLDIYTDSWSDSAKLYIEESITNILVKSIGR